MKVHQLIAHLQNLPPDAEVLVVGRNEMCPFTLVDDQVSDTKGFVTPNDEPVGGITLCFEDAVTAKWR